MEKAIFSESLRNAALEEVRAVYRQRQKLRQEYDDTYRKLDDLKEDIKHLEDSIRGLVDAFDFELRGVREEGKLVADPDYHQEYLRNYFMKDKEDEEDEYI